MAYQQKEGQGSLFVNQKQNDRQPDFRGRIMIKGIVYNLSAWNRVSQNGLQYLSLQAEEMQMNAPGPGYPQNNPFAQQPAPNQYQYGQQLPPRPAVPPSNNQVVFTKTQVYPQAPTYMNPQENKSQMQSGQMTPTQQAPATSPTPIPQQQNYTNPEDNQEDDLPF